jgi:hypothetical protein
MSETTVAPKNEIPGRQAAWTSETENAVDKSIDFTSETIAKTTEQQRKIFNEGVARVEDTHREMANTSAEDMDALFLFAGNAQSGVRDLQECLTGLVWSVIRANTRIAQELFLVESPRALLDLQQRFLHDYFDAYERGISALIRVANEAAKPATL